MVVLLTVSPWDNETDGLDLIGDLTEHFPPSVPRSALPAAPIPSSLSHTNSSAITSDLASAPAAHIVQLGSAPAQTSVKRGGQSSTRRPVTPDPARPNTLNMGPASSTMLSAVRSQHSTTSPSKPVSRPMSVQARSVGRAPSSPLISKVYRFDASDDLGDSSGLEVGASRVAARRFAKRLDVYAGQAIDRATASRRPIYPGSVFFPAGTGVPAWQRRGQMKPDVQPGGTLGTAAVGLDTQASGERPQSPPHLCIAPSWGDASNSGVGSTSIAASASMPLLPTLGGSGLVDLSAQPGIFSRRLVPAGRAESRSGQEDPPLTLFTVNIGSVPASAPDAAGVLEHSVPAPAPTHALEPLRPGGELPASTPVGAVPFVIGDPAPERRPRTADTTVPSGRMTRRLSEPHASAGALLHSARYSSLEAACQPAAFGGRRPPMATTLSRSSSRPSTPAAAPARVSGRVPTGSPTATPSPAPAPSLPPTSPPTPRAAPSAAASQPAQGPSLKPGAHAEAAMSAVPDAAEHRAKTREPARRRLKATTGDKYVRAAPAAHHTSMAPMQVRKLKTLPPPSAASGGMVLRQAAASDSPFYGVEHTLVGLGLFPLTRAGRFSHP